MERDSKKPARSLFSAILGGDRELVAELIRRGANLDRVSDGGWSPVMFATSRGDPALVQLLVDNGADPNMANRRGENPLVFAATKGAWDVVACLVACEKTDVGFQLPDGCSALHIAVKKGQSKIVRLLLRRGASPNTRDAGGHTPLMLGFAKSNAIRLEIVEILVKEGRDCDVNLVSHAGLTALEYECRTRCHETVEFLVQNGARVTDASIEAAVTDRTRMFLRTFETYVQLMLTRLDDRPVELGTAEFAVENTMQVFSPLMYCDMDYQYMNLDEEVVFIVLTADLKFRRAFCYDISQLKQLLEAREFVYECKAARDGMPGIKDLVEPCVPYLKISETCHHYVPALEVEHVLSHGLTTVAIVGGRRLKTVTALECIVVRSGCNYKGDYPNIVSRLHGQEGSELQVCAIRKLRAFSSTGA